MRSGTRARGCSAAGDTPAADLDVRWWQPCWWWRQLLADVPEVAELDINPLIVNHGVLALDARIRLSADRPLLRASSRSGPIRRSWPNRSGRRFRWSCPIRPEDELRHTRIPGEPSRGHPHAPVLQPKAHGRSELARPRIDYTRARDGVHRGGARSRWRAADPWAWHGVGRARTTAAPSSASFASVPLAPAWGASFWKLIATSAPTAMQQLVATVCGKNQRWSSLYSFGFRDALAQPEEDTGDIVLELQVMVSADRAGARQRLEVGCHGAAVRARPPSRLWPQHLRSAVAGASRCTAAAVAAATASRIASHTLMPSMKAARRQPCCREVVPVGSGQRVTRKRGGTSPAVGIFGCWVRAWPAGPLSSTSSSVVSQSRLRTKALRSGLDVQRRAPDWFTRRRMSGGQHAALAGHVFDRSPPAGTHRKQAVGTAGHQRGLVVAVILAGVEAAAPELIARIWQAACTSPSKGRVLWRDQFAAGEFGSHRMPQPDEGLASAKAVVARRARRVAAN